MSFKCPKCKSPLSVSISADTNFQKVQENIEAVISEADPYMALPWKQSQKKQNLSTILVNDASLSNATVKALYDRLREYGPSMKVGRTMYKLSRMESTGLEFLQQWRALNIG
jgi:hypothetical protein